MPIFVTDKRVKKVIKIKTKKAKTGEEPTPETSFITNASQTTTFNVNVP